MTETADPTPGLHHAGLLRLAGVVGVGVSLALGVLFQSSELGGRLRRGEPVEGVAVLSASATEASPLEALLLWRYDPRRGGVDVLSVPPATKIDLPDRRLRRINDVFLRAFRAGTGPLDAVGAVGVEAAGLLGESVVGRFSRRLHLSDDGLRALVDGLGGIPWVVESTEDVAPSTIGARMDGQAALNALRDVGELTERGLLLRQLDFLRALLTRLASPAGVCRWPLAVGGFRRGGASDFTWIDAVVLAGEWRRLRPADLNPWVLPGKAQGAAWVVDEERAALLRDRLATEDGAADEAPGASDGPVTVRVWNATRRPGFALTAARSLRAAGFDVLEWGNYRVRQSRTRVIDRAGRFDRARAVAEALGVTGVVSDVDPALRTDVEVVLGTDARVTEQTATDERRNDAWR